MKPKVLVVDDEKTLRFTFKEFLTEAGYNAVCVKDYKEALENINEDIDLVFTDILLGGKTGIDILGEIKRRGLLCPVIVMTGFPDIETAVEAVRLGAFAYVRKPVEQDALLRMTTVALKFKKEIEEKEIYRANLDAVFSSVKEGIVSVDTDMRVIEFNEAAARICGLTKEVYGLPLGEPPGYCRQRCINALKKTLDTGKGIDSERIECHHEDRLQVVSVSTSPLFDQKGLFKGAILVISDESRLIELERGLERRKELNKIVGNSRKMREIYSMVENLANLDTTVLITGESGTGKELVAEALYSMSNRKDKGPFVEINCAAIPENLIESELFGHDKGAFTGAATTQIGKLELAKDGVIFLDEVGDMSLSLQSKLLRVLQNLEFYRVGGRVKIKTNTRVIAATNKDLREKVRLGKFREDLFYRLKVVELDIPPLRERKADIPDLVNHFLKRLNKKLNKNIKGVSSDVQSLFMEYHWPGNVRELEHALEHACIVCNKLVITLEDLPDDLKVGAYGHTPLQHVEDEPRMIMQALEKTKWNKAETARLLGMDRSTLYRKMEKYKIL